jgi:hypothetical protein
MVRLIFYARMDRLAFSARVSRLSFSARMTRLAFSARMAFHITQNPGENTSFASVLRAVNMAKRVCGDCPVPDCVKNTY